MRNWLRDASLGAALLAVLHGATAEACTCKPARPPSEALVKATHVFAGRVTNSDVRNVRFTVSRVWKGTVEAEAGVLNIFPTCDYSFVKGVEYLVYTSDFRVTLCSRILPLAEAEEDLAVLGPGREP